MLANSINNFPVRIFGNQATTHQKKIDRMVERTTQKRRKAARLYLIGVEQDGECFASGLLVTTKRSVQVRSGRVRGMRYFQLLLSD